MRKSKANKNEEMEKGVDIDRDVREIQKVQIGIK